MKNIIIIGNGIAGITAARHIRKRSDHSITVISSETEHFFSRTALMYIYMGHMGFENIKPYEDWFWKKNRIDLVRDHVEQVITTDKTVKLSGGRTISYDILIIATGSKPNKFGWPGQDLIGVQGLYSFQDLQEMETNTIHIKRAVIVGGGLIGIEMAEMLLSRKIEVTFLIRENSFWSNVLPQQEANLISRHVREHHIDLREETELEKILSDENGKVKGVVTKSGEEIDCQFVGLTVGVSPNVAFLKDSGIEIQRGVLVNEYLETNITDVYAIGDCVERTYDLPGRKSIEQVWYTGRMMGEVVAQTICNSRTKYEPGPWFNSAKFLDIEYQTYGNVWNEPKPNEEEFYWEHQGGKKAIHFVWDRDSKQFLGVNVFGIRLRHELFDQWLREKKSIQFVLQNLSSANFDPEFFDRHEKEIVSDFEEKVFEVKSAIA
ncbi:MAG TPA: FAD-dependent oxidoreductase [Cyclobacteriaceae bacterium]|nr:FAD-dependent oxidoreductase [Cyclobacteriaceae bacterium]